MKVKELMLKLKQLNPDLEIRIDDEGEDGYYDLKDINCIFDEGYQLVVNLISSNG